jgi:predicted 2-oxoglutarate/Fe(II)-dependent dioxygenase YbiX
MKISEYFEPRNHIVIDEFFLPQHLEQVWSEIIKLENKMEIGLQGTNDNRYRDIKRNRNFHLEPDSKNIITDLVVKYLWHPTFLDILNLQKSSFGQPLRFCNPRPVHVSCYQDQDHYGFHVDENQPSNLTVVIFLCKEPKEFSGGNFILKHGKSQKVVQFKNNRMLIFPSNTLHKVTNVHLSENTYSNSRFSLQMWPLLQVQSAPQPVIMLDPTQKKDEKSEGSYYKPRFSLDEDKWKNIEKLMSLVNFQRNWQGSDPVAIFSGTQGVFSALTANLKFISRKYLGNRQTSVATKFFKDGTSGSDLAVTQCTFLSDSYEFVFGYAIAKEKESLKVRLFVRLVEQEKEIEKKIAISTGLDFDKTMDQLRKLIDSLASEMVTHAAREVKDLMVDKNRTEIRTEQAG